MVTLVAELDVRSVEAGMARIRQSLDELGRDASAAGAGLDQAFGGSAKGLNETADASKNVGTQSKAADLLVRGLGVALAGVSAGAIVRGIADLSTNFNLAQRAIATVVPIASEASGVTAELADVAADAGISFVGTAQTFQQFSIATRSLNLSQSETIGLVETLSRGLSIFATSTASAEAAQLQLAQAFASGVLQGDEFKSVAENFPPLIDAIAEVLGIARDEVKGFASDGAITSDILVQAFGALETQLDDLGGTVERTTGQAFEGLTTRLSVLIGNIDDSVGVTALFTQAFDNAATNIDAVTDFLFPLNDELEESSTNLAVLAQEAASSGGAAAALGGTLGQTTEATARYNDALIEHNLLLAETAREATLAAISGGELSDSVGLSTLSFGQAAVAFEEANGGLTGFRLEAAEAARGAALVALANQDLGDTAFAAGINYKTLNDETVAAADNSARAALAAEQEAEARRQAAEQARQQAEALREFNQDLDRQIELFDAAAQARRDAAFEEFNDQLDRQVELWDQVNAAQEETFRGLATNVGEVFGVSGATVDEFFDNFTTLLGQLGIEADAQFRNIANVIAESLGTSTAQLDGFFGLAVEGLDVLGVEFEDVFGNKLTGVIERFAGLSSNEINALGGIFGSVAGVIGNIFTPEVDNASTSFLNLGFAGNESVGGISTQVDGLIGQVFGMTGSIDGATGALGGLGASSVVQGGLLAGMFALGVEGFQSLSSEVGGLEAGLLTVLAPAIVVTEGLLNQFGLSGVGVYEAVRDAAVDAFNVIGNIASEVFNALQAGGQVLLNGLQAVTNGLASAFTAAFNVVQNVATAAFNAVAAAGQALGNLLGGVFNAIQNAASAAFNAVQNVAAAAFNAIAGAAQALGNILGGVFNAIANAASAAFNVVQNVATSAFNVISGAANALGGVVSGVFNTIAGVASSAFSAAANAASAAFGGIIDAAQSAAGSVSGILGGISGSVGGIVGSIGGAIGSIGGAIGGLFAEGGVITGPTSLAGPGMAGKRFASGTVLGSPTLLGNAGNVTATSNLGLAGEAGPEGILPLTKTSRGLGVTATGVGTTNITKIILIEGVDRAETDRIKQQFLDLDASIETRAGNAAIDVLLGAT